ncbi:hypothetical protein DL89DRAFT_283738 [Linderina pennispora]|uniref:Protein kinase domain-containing protein n=1 Tax=Linderina pennispora TaxID=61395 RepID=A0A1Y1W9L9_9FUNG|nr:uncharacterized protein DL89DRAFT_283738 [Linderina pennispora]ORX70142.1 hypothetical protein DL89DRAFT_283738 [Linderina pennispora]
MHTLPSAQDSSNLLPSPLSTTPAHTTDYHTENNTSGEEPEFTGCFSEYSSELVGHGDYSFDMEGIASKFWPDGTLEQSMAASKGKFADILSDLPVFLSDESELFSSSDGVQLRFSKVLLSMCFERVWNRMRESAASAISKRLGAGLLPDLVDFQTDEAAGADGNTNLMFCSKESCRYDYSSALILVECDLGKYLGLLPDSVLERIGRRVLNVWRLQPTRQFVPVLFLSVLNLKLLLFTRDKWYCVELGDIGYYTLQPDWSDLSDVDLVLQRLWFLASSPPSEIGHVCNISTNDSGLAFTKATSVYKLSAVPIYTPDAFIIEDLIQSAGSLRGRLCHVIRGQYGGDAAVMKISWTPAGQFPEGAAYDILSQQGVGPIPEVYCGGVLVEDLCGYRMEFLVVEDCGWSLYDCFDKAPQPSEEATVDTIIGIARQVSSCLAKAYSAGVLHRDISRGNITIKGQKAYIIDWGCSRPLVDAVNQEAHVNACRQWLFNASEVSQVERLHDPFVGTARYMSIQILLASKKRGLHDDIESLFYVVLDILMKLQIERQGYELAVDPLEVLDDDEMALHRTAALEYKDEYLSWFGIGDCPTNLKCVLNAMYDYLFVVDGTNITNDMYNGRVSRESHDLVAAAQFMDADAVKALKRACMPASN